MYPEFIPIYAALGAILLILTVVLVLLIIVLKKVSRQSTGSKGSVNPSAGLSGKNMVFCKKCAAQYDSSESCCPNCGAPR